jgi:hypothetical protein
MRAIPAFGAGGVMSTASVRKSRLEKDRCREVGGPMDGSDTRVICFLAFLEEQNKNLRKAIVDLSLENFILRNSADS